MKSVDSSSPFLRQVDTNNMTSRFDRVVDVDAAHGVHMEAMEGARHFLAEQLHLGLQPVERDDRVS
jgi:hypothetical protein